MHRIATFTSPPVLLSLALTWATARPAAAQTAPAAPSAPNAQQPSSPAPSPANASGATPSAAHADPKDEAIARFKRGLELHGEGDASAALIEFRRAYTLAPHYRVLYNIAQVCYDLKNYACALQSFEKYLSDGGTAISSDRRAEVEREVARLRARVARIEVVTNVPGATITVDDAEVGVSPLPAPLVVSAGKRRITASKEGRMAITRVLDVAGTESVRVELELADPSAGSASSVAAPERPSKWTTASWIGLGLTGVFAGTAAVTGVAALDASKTMQNTRFSGDAPSAEVTSASTKAKTFALVSDVATVAAVGTLATTLILTFARSPSAETEAPPRRATVLVGPTGASIQGVF